MSPVHRIQNPQYKPVVESYGSDADLTAGVALVTGSGRGIGRELALGLARHGARVVVQGRTCAQVTQTVGAVRAEGGTAFASVGDVTDPTYVGATVLSVLENLGPIDLLVNNAGAVDPTEAPSWESDQDDWWEVVTVNLRGPMLTCSAVVPGMLRRGRGRIVNINTLAASRTDPSYSAYSAAKAGLMRLTDSMGAALAGSGLSVFDVSPGLVRTKMTAGMPMWAQVLPEDWTPVDRVVDLVVRLARGHGDALSGRFIHASDDLDALVAEAATMTPDARKLRIHRYADSDPLPR